MSEETGLHYFGARYFDARTSVWPSVDPILGRYLGGKAGMGGVFNSRNLGLYSYSHLNPVRYVDPDGRNPVVIGAIVGAVFGGGGELISQLIKNRGRLGDINWGNVGKAALVGGIFGAITGGLEWAALNPGQSVWGLTISAKLAKIAGGASIISSGLENVVKNAWINGKATIGNFLAGAIGQGVNLGTQIFIYPNFIQPRIKYTSFYKKSFCNHLTGETESGGDLIKKGVGKAAGLVSEEMVDYAF
ncbi:MAG: hypothetical protein BWK79_19300 [Beggiatoa sp. IS2]|nr:MAG: hypothetical protein BWK79_19300 [Beggiatoa sp. IS2]